jgi:hypothetical protein
MLSTLFVPKKDRRPNKIILVNDMLLDGEIKQSDSPWSSPAVCVTNINDETRFCVGYHVRNEVTKEDHFPYISDSFQIPVCVYCGSNSSGYWQVKKPVTLERLMRQLLCAPVGLLFGVYQ